MFWSGGVLEGSDEGYFQKCLVQNLRTFLEILSPEVLVWLFRVAYFNFNYLLQGPTSFHGELSRTVLFVAHFLLLELGSRS